MWTSTQYARRFVYQNQGMTHHYQTELLANGLVSLTMTRADGSAYDKNAFCMFPRDGWVRPWDQQTQQDDAQTADFVNNNIKMTAILSGGNHTVLLSYAHRGALDYPHSSMILDRKMVQLLNADYDMFPPLALAGIPAASDIRPLADTLLGTRHPETQD